MKWYLENQEWLDGVTSGEYEKYYENMYGGEVEKGKKVERVEKVEGLKRD